MFLEQTKDRRFLFDADKSPATAPETRLNTSGLAKKSKEGDQGAITIRIWFDQQLNASLSAMSLDICP